MNRKFNQGDVMPKYTTKQRCVLMEYLENHPDIALSAQKIAHELKDENISVSAIYRNLSLLEKEGVLIREPSHEAKEAMFRYIGSKACKDVLHLSCKKCGKTYHMDESVSKSLIVALSDTSDFSLDRNDTVLYGLCGDCKSAQVKPNR